MKLILILRSFGFPQALCLSFCYHLTILHSVILAFCVQKYQKVQKYIAQYHINRTAPFVSISRGTSLFIHIHIVILAARLGLVEAKTYKANRFDVQRWNLKVKVGLYGWATVKENSKH